MVTGPPVIRLQGFGKRYRGRPAVSGVTLEIRRGEVYGLIGPDGAGKSSVMKAVAGVLAFEAGIVEVFGTRLDSERRAERIKDRIGFMPQGLGLNLYPDLSVEENVDFFARLRLVPAPVLEERKARLLRMTRLDRFRGRPMRKLSGGMKQKLGLVCTLIHAPDLVILDEPTTGVDPVSRRDFWSILDQLVNERAMTALVSTAYMDEAGRFDGLALLSDGEVVAQGDLQDILRLVRGVRVVVRAERQAEALARLAAAFPQVEPLGSEIHVFAEDTDAAGASRAVRRALDGSPGYRLETAAPELEDVFVSLLRRRHDQPRLRVQPRYAPAVAAREGVTIAVDARELVRDFGAFRAVDHVSFRIRQGEIFGLVGPNGSGKTTVIKMLTGLLPPTSGTGLVAGVDMRHAGRAIKERVGYMSQAFSLYRDLTVAENIGLYAGVYGVEPAEARTRAEWIVEVAGLAGHERVQAGHLPMGGRQRLALGCTLIHRPHVLFLDEPTSGVDPIGRRRFWEIVFRLSREEGVAVLVTTHYMAETEHCDHLGLMFAGRLVADAPPGELKRAVQAEAGSLLELATDRPDEALRRLADYGFPGGALVGRRIHLFSQRPDDDAERIRAALTAAGVHVESIEPRALSMEDVFLYRVAALERGEPDSRAVA